MAKKQKARKLSANGSQIVLTLTPVDMRLLKREAKLTEVTPEHIISSALFGYFEKLGEELDDLVQRKRETRRSKSRQEEDKRFENMDSGTTDLIDALRRSVASGRREERKKRGSMLRYAKALSIALQEAVDFDPIRHHNSPPPELRLNGKAYLDELRVVVSELNRLNAAIEADRSDRELQKTARTFAGHFSKFLENYAGTIGKGAAALTIGTAAGLLYQVGIGQAFIEQIWGHLKLLK